MKKWLIGITVLLIVVAAGYGLVNRFSYTNSSAAEDFENQKNVLVKSEDGWFAEEQELIECLSNAAFILRVRTIGQQEYLFNATRQLVEVQEVYAGSTLAPGDEIYIGDEGRFVRSDVENLNMGYHNFMKVGEEYLVFIDEKLETYKNDGRDTYLLMGYWISPMFCYDKIQNLVVPVSEDGTVLYESVKDNEFFGESEEVYKYFEDIKEALLKKYPQND